MTDVNWQVSVSAAALAAVLSICTSLTGLPELEAHGAEGYGLAALRNDDDRSDNAGKIE